MTESIDFKDIKTTQFDDCKLMDMTYQDIFKRIIDLITACSKDGSYIQPAGADYFIDGKHTVKPVSYRDIELFKKNTKRGKKTMFKYQFKNETELYKFLNLKHFELFSLFHRNNLNWIDVSNITDMQELFSNTKYNADISMWDVSNVTNMALMFTGSQIDCDLSKWDVSHVEKMSGMFAFSEFNHDVSMWDVSNVTDIETWRELYVETESMYWMPNNSKMPKFKRDIENMNMLKEDFNFNDVKTDDNSAINDLMIKHSIIDYFKGAKSWTQNDKITGKEAIIVRDGHIYFNRAVTIDIIRVKDVDADGNLIDHPIGFWSWLLTTFDHDKLHFRSCIMKNFPSGLKKLKVPPFVTKINITTVYPGGIGAMSSALEELIFDDNSECTNVYKSFKNCSKLKYVKLPKLMKKIDAYAFAYCTNLETVVLPECLTHIDDYAFVGCKRLKELKNFNANINLAGNIAVFHQDFIKRTLVSAFGK